MTDHIENDLVNDSKSRKIFITPEDALEFLSNNTLNRKVRKVQVDEIARDIVNNHWDLNGETIKISVNGDIIDGQHRLLAIMKARKGVWTYLVTDLPESTRYTVDNGLRRTPADHLRLQGEVSAGNLAPVLSITWQYLNGHGFNTHNRATQRDRLALLEAHPELRRSTEIGYRVYQGYRPFNRTAVAVAHFAISQVDTEMHPEFFARLEDGSNIETGHPIHTLRKRVLADRNDMLRLTISDHIGRVVYTWNRWLDYKEAGKKLYRMQFPPGTPIPDVEKPGRIRQEELDGS